VATPTTQTFRLPLPLPGAAGAGVSVAVTSGGGTRPVVVLEGASAALVGRLTRAGFASVTFEAHASGALDVVLDALERGVLGLPAQRCGLVECGDDGSMVVRRIEAGARLPGVTVRDPSPDRAGAAVVQWLTQHVV